MIFAENLPFHILEYGVHICLEVDACFDMEFKGHDVHFFFGPHCVVTRRSTQNREMKWLA